MRIAHGEPAPFERSGRGLRRFFQATGPYRRDLWMGVALLPFVVALQLVQPWLLKVAIDGDPETMLHAGLLLIAAVIAGYGFGAVHTYLLQRAGHRTLTALRGQVFRHLLAQGTPFFDRRPVGSLLSRVTSDSESVGMTFTLGLISLLSDFLLVAGTLAAMFAFDAGLTAWMLLLAPPIYGLVRLFNRLLRGFAFHIRRAVARVNSTIEENLAGRAIVHLFSRETQSQIEMEEHTGRYFRLYFRFNIADASLYAIMESLAALSIGGVIWLSTGPVLDGLMTLGLVVAFVEYVQRAYVPIKEMSGKLAGLQSAFAALDRMDRSLGYDEIPPRGSSRWTERRGAIDFNHLGFAYREDGPEVLGDLDLHIRPGETVAVVGPTGSGKTTLLNLLTRHYRPSRGEIRVDGVPLDTIMEEDFRDGVGIVRQDVFLFEGTVLDNVTLGDPRIDREQAAAALRAVALEDLVVARGGLDAPVEEGGRNLSAGEAQLLTLARVMARDPAILLLDEATARVDSLTENRIGEAIRTLMHERTVLVVAHRLATVQAADRILVLVEGRICEMGPHAELVARNGLYARMWRQRLRAADPG